MTDHPLNTATLTRVRALMTRAGIQEQDLREQFVAGSGSGGQKRNKTASCVRLVHQPSATAVRCDTSRSREVNRWLARRLLAQRLLARVDAEVDAQRQARERIRRQKRRRTRRQKARMLADKRLHGERKRLRAGVSPGYDGP